MGLKDIGETLPPGFRFYPSDEELVCHYLYKKITNEQALKGTLVEIDLHICEPWQLPDVAKLNATEWYFFSFRDRKYATGFRTNRATTCGYWKATGKDRVILDSRTRQIVGMRKTLVFYRNRAPNGIKTAWIMHEFRMETPHMPPKEDWVLCRVFHKGKEEAGSHHNLRIFDAVTAAPPPSAEQTAGYERSDSFSSNPSSQIQTQTEIPDALDSALLQLLRRTNPNPAAAANGLFMNDDVVMESSKNDEDDHDGYGFMWEMGLDDDSLGHGALHDHHRHQFGDMAFEDDNGIVLL